AEGAGAELAADGLAASAPIMRLATRGTIRNMGAIMPAVRLDRVCKRFGNHLAVDDLTLEVPVGSVYGFIGPNGSGKTTTLRMILHILLPDSGRIEVLGDSRTAIAQAPTSYRPTQRRISQ